MSEDKYLDYWVVGITRPVRQVRELPYRWSPEESAWVPVAGHVTVTPEGLEADGSPYLRIYVDGVDNGLYGIGHDVFPSRAAAEANRIRRVRERRDALTREAAALNEIIERSEKPYVDDTGIDYLDYWYVSVDMPWEKAKTLRKENPHAEHAELGDAPAGVPPLTKYIWIRSGSFRTRGYVLGGHVFRTKGEADAARLKLVSASLERAEASVRKFTEMRARVEEEILEEGRR